MYFIFYLYVIKINFQNCRNEILYINLNSKLASGLMSGLKVLNCSSKIYLKKRII